VTCTSAVISTADSIGSVGRFSSIAIGADGLGLVSYVGGNPDNGLKVVHLPYGY
jgi:hypothetical protein